MNNYISIMKKHKREEDGLIQALHEVQAKLNYIPPEAIDAASEVFGLSTNEIHGVITFYTYFSTEPKGKYIIRICRSAPCHVSGAPQVIKAFEKELGISIGETTPNGKFTLEFTECVGQCQGSPTITINGKPHMDVHPEDVPQILKLLK